MLVKRKNGMKFNLELRPHHLLGYFKHEAYIEWYNMFDEEYIARFREEKGNFHSDELIIHWRNILRQLHENPNLRIRYVFGLDSVCEKCDKKNLCSDRKHWAYESVKKADIDAIEKLPDLKLGKVYDGHFLKKLFKKKNLV